MVAPIGGERQAAPAEAAEAGRAGEASTARQGGASTGRALAAERTEGR